jgi:hypothetical protein
VAITHRLVVDAATGAATVADALSRLGSAIGEIYNGLDADDGRALGDEWRALLADLASSAAPTRAGWLACYGESTANWWPVGTALGVRGLVNAVVRSPRVEVFHAGDHVSFYDNQLGTFCANWAAATILDELADPDGAPILLGAGDPAGWGLTSGDRERAAATPLFFAAAERFPVASAYITALGHCATSGTNREAVGLVGAGTAAQAAAWMAGHAGTTRPARDGRGRDGGDSITNVRSAWTSPTPAELDRLAGRIWAVSGLTRLSRDPSHLAAAIQWAVRSEVPIVSPNVLIREGEVGFRQPLVAAPADVGNAPSPQASHLDSWANPAGLSPAAAELTAEVAEATASLATDSAPISRPGRNDPCWCGSGKKFKFCHLR